MKNRCNICKAPRVDYNDLHCPWCQERNALQAENERLRGALEIIADNDQADGRPFAIARAALGGEGE